MTARSLALEYAPPKLGYCQFCHSEGCRASYASPSPRLKSHRLAVALTGMIPVLSFFGVRRLVELRLSGFTMLLSNIDGNSIPVMFSIA